MSEEEIRKEEPEKKEYTKKIGDYILLEQIGQGTFSKVTRAIHTISEQIVAVKILDKKKIEDEIDIERIDREIEILKNIYHPNICQMYETYTTIHNYYLMMEYVQGGDLFDYISENSYLPEQKACYFFRQLISVMEYLSSLGISHRDIKPENILLNEDHSQIKVIDFGLSNFSDKSELLHSSCGSPCYASPEMLSGDPYWGLGTDIWSAGVVLYSMLAGGLPFDDLELKSLYAQIKSGKFYIPSNLSLEAIDLLKRILRVEPEKRIKIEEIKKHKWFNIEKNVMYKGVNIYYEKMPCDVKVVQYIIKKYFNEDNISLFNFTRMIKGYACNKYTATYYLVKKYLLLKKDNTIKESNEIIVEENDTENKEKNENKISDNYKKVYKEIKQTKEEINSNLKNKINDDKFINTDNLRNFSNDKYNYLNLTTKIEPNNNINKTDKIKKDNLSIKIERKKLENNVLIKTKPKIKTEKRNKKNKEIMEYSKKTENNSEIKLGLSLINIMGVNSKNYINDMTDRNITEKNKNYNYINKISSITNTNSNNDIYSRNVKNSNKKNKKLKTYLNKYISPKKGKLNFYVINNIINKEKQSKEKREKNESTINNDNIILNINNNNYINNSVNRNNLSIENQLIKTQDIINNNISPINKIKKDFNQIKVNLKPNKPEINNTITPRNKYIFRKTEKNSPKNYFKLDIFSKKIKDIYKSKKRKTTLPSNELKINNKSSNLIKFNSNLLNNKSKEKDVINKTNNLIISKKNKNVINKEKLKQDVIKHKKIKSLYEQNNNIFNYFKENKKYNNNNNHKRNITSVLRYQLTDIKNSNQYYLNTITNDINSNNTLSYSGEKIIYKPKRKGNKRQNLILNNNKDLNSLMMDKLKRNKLIIYNNKNNNHKNNNSINNYFIRLGQSNSTNNYYLTGNFHKINRINDNTNNIFFNN